MDQAEYQRRLAQGYPESVAQRIATGELPMDEASRMDRAKLTDLDLDRTLYHFSPVAGITEFLPSTWGKMGAGLYTTPVPSYGQKYGENRYDLVTRRVPAFSEERLSIPRDSSLSRDERGEALRRALLEKGFTTTEAGYIREGEPRLDKDILEVNILDPQKDVRDINKAAFDPEYKGPNILGALTSGFGILGLLGLASAPREAQAQGLLEMLMPPTAEAFRAQGAGAGSDMPMTDEQYNEMVRMLNAR